MSGNCFPDLLFVFLVTTLLFFTVFLYFIVVSDPLKACKILRVLDCFKTRHARFDVSFLGDDA
jgi:hypothetical protein